MTGAKALKLYIYKYLRFGLPFSASHWWVIWIFDDFSQNTLFFYFCPRNHFYTSLTPKSNFRWFGVPQTKLCHSNWGKPEAILGDLLVGSGRPSGVFHPWKCGKDPTRNGGHMGGPKWGSKILITPAISPTGKTLEAENGQCRFRHVDFHPILQAGVETNGTFNLC